MTQDIVLEARGLVKHYPVATGFLQPKGLARALDGVSFRLTAGRTLAVVGESGCGKSTLARQLTMIEAPTAGHLLLAGADVTEADAALRRQLRQRVQMVFQNPFASLNPRKKIGHALEEPLAINTSDSPAFWTSQRDQVSRLNLSHSTSVARQHRFFIPSCACLRDFSVSLRGWGFVKGLDGTRTKNFCLAELFTH